MPNLLRANFVNNPNTRSYQPRTYTNDYHVPERVYQYTASIQRELPGNVRDLYRRLRRQPGTQPVPAQRCQSESLEWSVNPANAALVIREFSMSSATPPATSPACRIRTRRSNTKPVAATTNTRPCSCRWPAACRKA